MRLSKQSWVIATALVAMLGCSSDKPTQNPAEPVADARLDVVSVGTGTGTIGGKAFVDKNANHVYDAGDMLLGGINVYLQDCDHNEIAATVTDASGAYGFINVDPGLYVVRFERLDNFTFVATNQGADPCNDNNANSLGETVCFENEAGDQDICWDGGQREGRLKGGTPGSCRVTGGGVDEFGDWDGYTLTNGTCKRNRYTFGGQAGANTALQPQPAGEWEHNNHSGPDGSFAFHGGTHSAPDGTEIDRIECSDPGFCNQARPAPAKQIDFWGVGIFHNTKNLSPLMKANVVEQESLHWFEVNIDDGGEGGNKKVIANCPPNGFGLRGDIALVDCGCLDFYRITIHATEDPASPVIYQVYGYPPGGNLQIHPLTGFDD